LFALGPISARPAQTLRARDERG